MINLSKEIKNESKYIYFPEDPNAPNITEKKINSFKQLKKGWHYGEGVSFKSTVLKQAIELNSYARSLGFLKTDAFPGINGEIMVTIYHLEHYLEFTIEDTETITFCREKNDIETSYQEGLKFEQVKEKIKNFGKEIWTQFAYYTSNITIGFKEDLKALRLKTQGKERTKGFQSLIENVYSPLVTESASILGIIIKKQAQQVSHQFIGSS